MASAQLFLNGARVTREFRGALFDQVNHAGITPNEFVITTAAEKLKRSSADFPGIFHGGDLDMVGVMPQSDTAPRAAWWLTST